MASSSSHYEVLGISPTANAAEIKQAYRRLAKAEHPDQNPSPEANARFSRINEAYRILSDPLQRMRYDRSLNASTPSPSRTPPPNWPPAYEPPATTTYGHAQYEPKTEFSEEYFRAKASKEKRNNASFQPYVPIFRRAAVGFLLFSILLGIDYGLRSPQGPFVIESISAELFHGVGGTRVNARQESLVMRGELMAVLEPGDRITSWRTPMLNIPVEVYIEVGWTPERRRMMPYWRSKYDLPNFDVSFPPRPNIFTLFSPVWILMTVMSLLMIALPVRKGERFFQLGLLMGFLGVFTIVLTIAS